MIHMGTAIVTYYSDILACTENVRNTAHVRLISSLSLPDTPQQQPCRQDFPVAMADLPSPQDPSRTPANARDPAKKKANRSRLAFWYLVEAAGIEPASASPPPSVLHA
jgi:hypothetical protein